MDNNMTKLDLTKYEKYLDSIVYCDIGAFPDLVIPFSSRTCSDQKNNVFLKKYIGIDPYFDEDEIDGKFVFYKCAISDIDDQKTFYVVSPQCSSALFRVDEIERAKIAGKSAASNVSEMKVKCKKLSSMIDENNWNIDILKIDAHGSEYVILQDIKEYMKDIAAIHIEAWTAQWYEDAVLFDKSHEFLDKCSFTPVCLMEPFQGISLDILYINENYKNVEKLNFIKTLYGVSEQTVMETHKEIKEQLNYIKEGNFCYQEWFERNRSK